jgi:hypothetical protein
VVAKEDGVEGLLLAIETELIVKKYQKKSDQAENSWRVSDPAKRLKPSDTSPSLLPEESRETARLHADEFI